MPFTGHSRMGAWRHSLVRDHAVLRLFMRNVAVVVPGRLVRSNHPTPGRLAGMTRRYGLRTIINLRGPRACGSDWLSRDAASRLGLRHIDMPFESRGAPHRERILRFAEIYRSLDGPALIHCKAGADRAGLAAGLAILFEGGTAAQALGQLSWRFGHWRRSRAGVLDAFFMRYASDAEGRVPFLHWVANEYDEAALRRDFVAAGLASFLVDRVLVRE